jgi:hypothetical protein
MIAVDAEGPGDTDWDLGGTDEVFDVAGEGRRIE